MSPADPANHPAAENAETLAASLTPPRGWTNDPEEMNLHYYWQGRPGDLKHLLQTAFKVPNPQPLLVRDPEIGDILFLLQSEDSVSKTKYYVWNGIESELHWIKSPAELQEIYKSIDEREGYLAGLEFEAVDGDE